MGTIIVDVKLAKFDGPIDTIWRSMKEVDAYWATNPDDRVPIEVTEHVIKQHCFVNRRKEKVYLGATPDVEEAIGLPFEVFTNMNKEIDDLTSIKNGMIERILRLKELESKIDNMNFFNRLHFLITGRV